MLRLFPMLLLLAACKGEPLPDQIDPSTTWRLTELNGQEFTAEATLTFPAPGLVAGRAPCNSFRASQSGNLPRVDVGPVLASRMACPELEAETRFLRALTAMSVASIEGQTLRLRAEDGQEMVFRAD